MKVFDIGQCQTICFQILLNFPHVFALKFIEELLEEKYEWNILFGKCQTVKEIKNKFYNKVYNKFNK